MGGSVSRTEAEEAYLACIRDGDYVAAEKARAGFTLTHDRYRDAILEASFAGHTHVVSLLVAPQMASANGDALLVAARLGHADVVQTLLLACPELVNAARCCEPWCLTPGMAAKDYFVIEEESGDAVDDVCALHVAAAGDHSEAIQVLVKQGAAIEATAHGLWCEASSCEQSNLTALHIACMGGCDDAVQALLELGCAPMHSTSRGLAPLHLAAAHPSLTSPRVIELLLQHHADVDAVSASSGGLGTALLMALEIGHLGAVEALRSSSVRLRDLEGRTYLHLLSMNGLAESLYSLDDGGGLGDLSAGTRAMLCDTIIEWLGEDKHGLVHARDLRGLTAFETAVADGQFLVAGVLLRHGVEPSREMVVQLICSEAGDPSELLGQIGEQCPAALEAGEAAETCLHWACKRQQSSTVRQLARLGCVARMMTHDHNEDTPLHVAVRARDHHSCRVILSQAAPEQVCAQDAAGCTVLQLVARGACCSGGQLGSSTEVDEQFKLILATDQRGEWEPDLMKLSEGYQILPLGRAKPMAGCLTPGRIWGHRELDGLDCTAQVASDALEVGGEALLQICDHNGDTALHVAAQLGVAPVVESILHHAGRWSKSSTLVCRLEVADTPQIRVRLATQVDCPEVRVLNPATGRSPLHCCAANPYPPFSAVCDGHVLYITPGAEHVAQLLLDHQADLSHRDCNGETALQIAERVIAVEWGHETIRREFDLAAKHGYSGRYILDVLRGEPPLAGQECPARFQYLQDGRVRPMGTKPTRE